MSRPPQFVPGGSQVSHNHFSSPLHTLFLIIARLLHKMIFIPPGTNKYPIQAWPKDSVEVKAERVEPQRVVLHPGGHDQDDHLLIAQLDGSKGHGKSNQWSLERILWIYLNTRVWLPDGFFGCSGASSTSTFEQHCIKLEADNKFGFSADHSFYIFFFCQFQWLLVPEIKVHTFLFFGVWTCI